MHQICDILLLAINLIPMVSLLFATDLVHPNDSMFCSVIVIIIYTCKYLQQFLFDFEDLIFYNWLNKTKKN